VQGGAASPPWPRAPADLRRSPRWPYRSIGPNRAGASLVGTCVQRSASPLHAQRRPAGPAAAAQQRGVVAETRSVSAPWRAERGKGTDSACRQQQPCWPVARWLAAAAAVAVLLDGPEQTTRRPGSGWLMSGCRRRQHCSEWSRDPHDRGQASCLPRPARARLCCALPPRRSCSSFRAKACSCCCCCSSPWSARFLSAPTIGDEARLEALTGWSELDSDGWCTASLAPARSTASLLAVPGQPGCTASLVRWPAWLFPNPPRRNLSRRPENDGRDL
jgi:hypothetical protein